jgi:hypothetical protein
MFYTDPGSGVLLWQILAAGAVGALFRAEIRALFRGKSGQFLPDAREPRCGK